MNCFIQIPEGVCDEKSREYAVVEITEDLMEIMNEAITIENPEMVEGAFFLARLAKICIYLGHVNWSVFGDCPEIRSSYFPASGI